MTQEELQSLSYLSPSPTSDYSLVLVLIALIVLIGAAIAMRIMYPVIPEYKYTER